LKVGKITQPKLIFITKKIPKIAEIKNETNKTKFQKNLCQKRLIIFFLTSQREHAYPKIKKIDKGKKLVEGTVKELFHPDDTVVYVETSDKSAGEELIRGSVYADKFIGTDAAGIELKLRKEDVPALTRFLVERGMDVLGVTARHSLEDYFLKITTANQHVEPFKN